ncbi:MAG: hypothetical protein ABI812_07685 [Betaproteobacteria bacterium]
MCPPCRAALRRARDDTISELLPLPGRRAFALSHSPDVRGRAKLAQAAGATGLRPAAGGRRRLTSAQLNAAAVIAFVAAAGVLALVTTRELQRERGFPAIPEALAAAGDPQGDVPRVSPTAMLGAARNESPVAHTPPEPELDAVAVAPPPERKPMRAPKAHPASAKAPVVLEPLPALAAFDVPPVAAPPLAAPRARAVLPDRAQLFTAALARCTGDFFARMGCQHRTRAHYCEGQWGQHPDCPAGIANDHGQ